MVKDHFLPTQSLLQNEKDTNFEKYFVKKWFANRFSELKKHQFGIKLQVQFAAFKINCYFKITSNTCHALNSKLSISLRVRVIGTCQILVCQHDSWDKSKEHLNLNASQKSAKKDHLRSSHHCSNWVCKCYFLQNLTELPCRL